MASQLRDLLRTTRRRQFVGREAELALFRRAIDSPTPPIGLLYVHGPGGIGKTSLLLEFLSLCGQSRIPAYYLDTRHVEPSPEAFLSSLSQLMGAAPEAELLASLSSSSHRLLLMIDTYEALSPLDSWLRESFLPQLSQSVLTVIAGRNPPAAEWRSDPGWQALLRALPLRNLSPQESRAYLKKRSIPEEHHTSLLQLTRGHPLALSLIADTFSQRGDYPPGMDMASDIVNAILDRFIQKVPGPAHRSALEACALLRTTNEAVLSAMLALPDVFELFSWLKSLSFIERGLRGIFPHDLARDALIAELRWRNPDWYAELHRRARTYYQARLRQADGHDQHAVLFDYVFLHRENLLVRPYFEWQASGGAFPDSAREEDRTTIVEMVRRHEGQQSAEYAAFWLEHQPGGALVFRELSGAIEGFLFCIHLHELDERQAAADPGALAAWRYLRAHAPLRQGEKATLFRFWMAREAYQAVSSIQSLITVHVVLHCLTTAGLAFTFLQVADPEFWAPASAYADLSYLPEASFSVDGRKYGVLGHDWRAVPPMAWLDLLARRELEMGLAIAQPPAAQENLLVLNQADFDSAIKEALRGYTQQESLHRNPLLRSRIILDRTGVLSSRAQRATALQDTLREAAETLRSSPRDAKLYRALLQTYFKPASSQERAAEELDLPFSTYRRHLQEGVARLTASLWEKEVGWEEK